MYRRSRRRGLNELAELVASLAVVQSGVLTSVARSTCARWLLRLLHARGASAWC